MTHLPATGKDIHVLIKSTSNRCISYWCCQLVQDKNFLSDYICVKQNHVSITQMNLGLKSSPRDTVISPEACIEHIVCGFCCAWSCGSTISTNQLGVCRSSVTELNVIIITTTKENSLFIKNPDRSTVVKRFRIFIAKSKSPRKKHLKCPFLLHMQF